MYCLSVDGVWRPWSNWTECSHSCGTGERERFRICDGPFYGGANCSDPADEQEPCNTHECPGTSLYIFSSIKHLEGDNSIRRNPYCLA